MMYVLPGIYATDPVAVFRNEPKRRSLSRLPLLEGLLSWTDTKTRTRARPWLCLYHEFMRRMNISKLFPIFATTMPTTLILLLCG